MKNGKIALRALEPEDLELLYKWENDTSLWQYSNNLTPFSRYLLKEYIAGSKLDIFATRQQRFMIVEQATERAIGTIDLFDFEPIHRRAGVGVLVYGESDRQKGYAAEALALLIDHCRRNLQLHSLWCNIITGNKSSRKLFEGQGFTLSGTKKEWLLINGKWHDEEIYQIIL